MTSPGSPSLDGVRLKVARAEELLAEIRNLADDARQQCGIRQEQRPDTGDAVWFVMNLPDPEARLRVLVGDFLHNLRSSLDYLVPELVLANGGSPITSNMFPVCETAAEFAQAIKRKRLLGTSPAAAAVVESLQPYQKAPSPRSHPLWLLDELVIIDKHRSLGVTTCLAKDAQVHYGGSQAYYFGSVHHDGDLLIGVNPSLVADHFNQAELRSAVTVGLRDEPAKDADVVSTLRGMLDHVKATVIPALEPLIK